MTGIKFDEKPPNCILKYDRYIFDEMTARVLRIFCLQASTKAIASHYSALIAITLLTVGSLCR